MSSKKRRVQRKIAMMVRMDNGHHICQMRWGRSDHQRRETAKRIEVCMQALGRSMNKNAADRSKVALSISRLRRWP